MSWILEYVVDYLMCVYIYVRLVMSSYLLFCCIYFDAWCITWCLKREETLKVYTVIGEEVLVLSLLVVMYKISN